MLMMFSIIAVIFLIGIGAGIYEDGVRDGQEKVLMDIQAEVSLDAVPRYHEIAFPTGTARNGPFTRGIWN